MHHRAPRIPRRGEREGRRGFSHLGENHGRCCRLRSSFGHDSSTLFYSSILLFYVRGREKGRFPGCGVLSSPPGPPLIVAHTIITNSKKSMSAARNSTRGHGGVNWNLSEKKAKVLCPPATESAPFIDKHVPTVESVPSLLCLSLRRDPGIRCIPAFGCQERPLVFIVFWLSDVRCGRREFCSKRRFRWHR